MLCITFGPLQKTSTHVLALAATLEVPSLVDLVRRFLYRQMHLDSDDSDTGAPSLDDCPPFSQRVYVHNSAEAVFHAPSDPSSVAGMRREFIRATRSWRKGQPRYDSVFVNTDSTLPGIFGLEIARVRCFFSFKYGGTDYSCALVHWYTRIGDAPDEDTGMFTVKPSLLWRRRPFLSVIHIETIYRAAHLIGVSNGRHIDLDNLEYYQSLDVFDRFYVNKFIDHHIFELLHS